MFWLFLLVVLMVVVYLAVKFPTFLIVLAAGAAWIYYIIHEDNKRKNFRGV